MLEPTQPAQQTQPTISPG